MTDEYEVRHKFALVQCLDPSTGQTEWRTAQVRGERFDRWLESERAAAFDEGWKARARLAPGNRVPNFEPAEAPRWENTYRRRS